MMINSGELVSKKRPHNGTTKVSFSNEMNAKNACKTKYRKECGGVTYTPSDKQYRLYKEKSQSPRLKLVKPLNFYSNPMKSWYRAVNKTRRRMLTDNECIVYNVENTACPIVTGLNWLLGKSTSGTC